MSGSKRILKSLDIHHPLTSSKLWQGSFAEFLQIFYIYYEKKTYRMILYKPAGTWCGCFGCDWSVGRFALTLGLLCLQ